MAEQRKAVPESDKPLVIAAKKRWYCGIYSPNPLALLHQSFEIFIPSGRRSVSPWGLFARWSWGGRAELCPRKPAARHHAVPSPRSPIQLSMHVVFYFFFFWWCRSGLRDAECCRPPRHTCVWGGWWLLCSPLSPSLGCALCILCSAFVLPESTASVWPVMPGWESHTEQ